MKKIKAVHGYASQHVHKRKIHGRCTFDLTRADMCDGYLILPSPNPPPPPPSFAAFAPLYRRLRDAADSQPHSHGPHEVIILNVNVRQTVRSPFFVSIDRV